MKSKTRKHAERFEIDIARARALADRGDNQGAWAVLEIMDDPRTESQYEAIESLVNRLPLQPCQ